MIFFQELPDWRFDAAEVSAGLYKLTGVCLGEPRFERAGADTTALLEECRREAARLAVLAEKNQIPNSKLQA